MRGSSSFQHKKPIASSTLALVSFLLFLSHLYHLDCIYCKTPENQRHLRHHNNNKNNKHSNRRIIGYQSSRDYDNHLALSEENENGGKLENWDLNQFYRSSNQCHDSMDCQSNCCAFKMGPRNQYPVQVCTDNSNNNEECIHLSSTATATTTAPYAGVISNSTNSTNTGNIDENSDPTTNGCDNNNEENKLPTQFYTNNNLPTNHQCNLSCQCLHGCCAWRPEYGHPNAVRVCVGDGLTRILDHCIQYLGDDGLGTPLPGIGGGSGSGGVAIPIGGIRASGNDNESNP